VFGLLVGNFAAEDNHSVPGMRRGAIAGQRWVAKNGKDGQGKQNACPTSPPRHLERPFPVFILPFWSHKSSQEWRIIVESILNQSLTGYKDKK
jgi:hypothetical protein